MRYFFSLERFGKAVSKIPVAGAEQYTEKIVPENNSVPEILFIKSGYEHLKISTDEFHFIQSEADDNEIFTSENKHLTVNIIQ